jgi:multidrug resistance efflux pump
MTKVVVTTISVFCGAVLLLVACSTNRGFDYSGTLQAESALVGSTIGGRITNVYVSDGQRVRKGDSIVAFDASTQRAALAAAQSQVAQAAAVLADLQAGARPQEIAKALAAEASAKAVFDKTPQELRIARDNVRQARAGLAQAQAAETQATLAYNRAEQLFGQGAIAAQARDDARATFVSARANVIAARARLTSARATYVEVQNSDTAVAQRSYESAVANRELVQAGARPQQVDQARAALDVAKASVAAAQTNLREMTVTAPADGTIDSLDLRAGDLVGPRAQVAVVREFRDPYVRIYVAQRDLGKVKVGNSVRVRSDALGGEIFDGTVEQIDQDAQFTPRDVQTTEDRADLVFGVKVRVHDPNQKLHGGTTVEVAF